MATSLGFQHESDESLSRLMTSGVGIELLGFQHDQDYETALSVQDTCQKGGMPVPQSIQQIIDCGGSGVAIDHAVISARRVNSLRVSDEEKTFCKVVALTVRIDLSQLPEGTKCIDVTAVAPDPRG